MPLSEVLFLHSNFFFHHQEATKQHVTIYFTHDLKEMSEMLRLAFTTKSYSPAINDVHSLTELQLFPPK